MHLDSRQAGLSLQASALALQEPDPSVMNSPLHIRCKLVLQYFTVLKTAISLVHKHLQKSFCFGKQNDLEAIGTEHARF
jgi:hypothetical protein